MAATTETFNGNGASFHGVIDRDRCLTDFVDEGSAQSYRYYISRRTVLEMLKDRGYDVLDSELNRSLTEFRSVFGNSPDLDSLRFSVSLRSNPHKKTLVMFLGTDEIKTANIRTVYGQILNKESLHGLILILQSKTNHFAKKELEKFPFKVEVFQITDLLVNITKHVLQPQMDILTAEQKQQVMNKYKLEDKQLPRMLESDAIVQYYGLQKGQMVKITYSGEIVDHLVTYRFVT
ncbi:DNA-directed RNA polymerase V subunit 5C [Populus nigra]|uniref:DNA-directed RNA polymerase V subunit 5C n=1 Tax=Populus nigra TaxID=3691 RepID=UPI002B2662BD|nr:DNA-directed RNA polymerase V subunit 5C [Populus nigra]